MRILEPHLQPKRIKRVCHSSVSADDLLFHCLGVRVSVSVSVSVSVCVCGVFYRRRTTARLGNDKHITFLAYVFCVFVSCALHIMDSRAPNMCTIHTFAARGTQFRKGMILRVLWNLGAKNGQKTCQATKGSFPAHPNFWDPLGWIETQADVPRSKNTSEGATISQNHG